jgi:hypothetical protein
MIVHILILSPSMNFNQLTTRDLLARLSTYKPSDIILQAASHQEAGHVFEALCFGLIATGCSPFGAVQMLKGNVNRRCDLSPYTFVKEALNRKVKQGGESGYSDISFTKTLKDTDDGTEFTSLYLTTCKWIREDASLDDYEIIKLIGAVAKNDLAKPYDGRVQYVVCCKNRQVFEKTWNASRSKKDMQIVHHILDIHDLDAAACAFKKLLTRVDSKIDRLLAEPTLKCPIRLKFHQELALEKTRDRMAKSNAPILWALKCRSGKSYIMAALIAERIMCAPKSSFLIITPIPMETLTQMEDMFNRHIEFSNMSVVSLTPSTLKQLIPTRPYILLASKQFLQKKTIDILQRLNIDTTFFDETHEGGSTVLSREILDMYANGHRVFLTATYSKPEYAWGISPERKLMWDMLDEELCKINDIKGLGERHGHAIVNSIVDKYDLPASYKRCPRMKIVSHFLNPEEVREIRTNSDMEGYGMDMETLFQVTRDNNDEPWRFVHQGRVQLLLKHIFQPHGKSIMNRIHELAVKHGSRMQGFHSQIWFVPYGSQATHVEGVASALHQQITAHGTGKKYRVVVIHANMECKPKDLTAFIRREERIALQEEKRGLIILSGMQASTGITLDRVDAVFLLNNEKSVDRIFQRMFRCMTESSDDSKPFGMVVDFNPSRVIRSVLTYADSMQMSAPESKTTHARLEEISRVIDFEDALMSRPRDEVIDMMVKLWARDTWNRYDYLKDMLGGISTDVMGVEDIRQWHECIDTLHVGKPAKVNSHEISVNTDDEKLSGNPVQDNDAAKNRQRERAHQDDACIMEIFAKELIPSVVHLSAILTADDTYTTDIIAILERICSDTELAGVFQSQLQCWWGASIRAPERIIELCIRLFSNYIKDMTRITHGIDMIKQSFANMLENKKDLLIFLNSILKPKETEKKQFGEVFTPLGLVEEMLDKLPAHVWSDPKLTWFDPAVGCGNFMVCVFYRLMEGLKQSIPDAEERQRHIIEKMLYMSELNAKNVLLCRRIFGDKANIHQGDTLVLDPRTAWDVVKGFDVVMGNPPYNDASGNKGKGHTLWTKFVEKSLMDWLKSGTGYLCMVHPALWRQAGHAMYQLLTSHQLLYVEIHHEKDGLQTFKCNTRYDWYVLQNRPYQSATLVKDQEGETSLLDMRDWSFLPNCRFDMVKRLIAKPGEERCEIIHSRSAYGGDKKHISKTRTREHKYPVVYAMHQDGSIVTFWSSCNDRGHFGIEKVIMRTATPLLSFISDANGEYGMTQWTFGFPAPKDHHARIMSLLKSPSFRHVMDAIALRHEINLDALRHFKERFWDYL